MTFRKSIILKRILLAIMGAVIIIAGFFRNDILIYMGTAIIAGDCVSLIRYLPYLRDDKKLKELEHLYNDERTIFISQKSYAMSFWISVLGEFVLVAITAFLNLDGYMQLLSTIVCIQLIIYIIMQRIYNKKY